VKYVAGFFARRGAKAALAAVAMVAGGGQALAQAAPASCIAELEKQYGAGPGLQASCSGGTDCTFQAPTGNASARALIDAIAKRAEACFIGAGLKLASEETLAVGTTRHFDGTGDARCAVLIASPTGLPPEGVRAVCQPK
jgi:hypothetical protein